MIKTKVICTLGPAVDDTEVLRKLINSGMDVARMNFSHGTHEEHLVRLKNFRYVCEQEGVVIPLLLDTKGPEIRLGIFPEGETELVEGQDYVLTTRKTDCGSSCACVSHEGLPGDVKPGDNILIDDGLIRLTVKSISDTEIFCQVMNGGKVSSRKSVNVPGVNVSLPSLTEQDKQDILFAVKHDYDFIAVSFARRKEDIAVIQHFLEEHGGGSIKLIAKIESREGVKNLKEIIRISDGVMVARGDLGVELPVEEIPVVQKDMIKLCYSSGKPVITATQMLDSMIRNPRPTRAEVTDVANAIFDGTSAIMLSGETAIGKYPVEALATMVRIAKTTEESISYWKRFRSIETMGMRSVTAAISHATCTTAMDLNAAAIIAITTSGRTARHISSFRPAVPIVAATTDVQVMRQMRLSWGVWPIVVSSVASTDELFKVSAEAARKSDIVGNGDLIVVTAGVPVGTSGTTNMLKVQMVGNILCLGKGLGGGEATAPLCIINRNMQDKSEFERGSILVIDEISDSVIPLMRISSGVVLDGEDKQGQAGTLAKALGLPFIIEAEGAVNLLKTGTLITIDGNEGTVKSAE